MPVPPNLENPTESSNTKPRIWWALLLPVALGAGVLWQQNQSPTDLAPPQNIQSSTQSPSPAPKPTVTQQLAIPTSILVVGNDGKLHSKSWTNAPEADAKTLHARWLNAVIAASPDMFPARARVNSVKIGNDAEPAQVDFNAAFAAPAFWNGETKTKLAIYAIVNTLASIMSPKGGDVPVRITVEGKPLQTLGEFDLSDTVAPNYLLNATANTNPNATAKNAEKTTTQTASTKP